MQGKYNHIIQSICNHYLVHIIIFIYLLVFLDRIFTLYERGHSLSHTVLSTSAPLLKNHGHVPPKKNPLPPSFNSWKKTPLLLFSRVFCFHRGAWFGRFFFGPLPFESRGHACHLGLDFKDLALGRFEPRPAELRPLGAAATREMRVSLA